MLGPASWYGPPGTNTMSFAVESTRASFTAISRGAQAESREPRPGAVRRAHCRDRDEAIFGDHEPIIAPRHATLANRRLAEQDAVAGLRCRRIKALDPHARTRRLARHRQNVGDLGHHPC